MRTYIPKTFDDIQRAEKKSVQKALTASVMFLVVMALLPVIAGLPVFLFFILGCLPAVGFAYASFVASRKYALEQERDRESKKRSGNKVLGMPPDRAALARQLEEDRSKGKKMISKYLVGFELETGEPMWVKDDDMCSHGCVFAKTGVGKTLFLESLMLQQMARGRASGLTFIDAKRDSSTLAHIIVMAIITGRIEDLVVVDPFDPVHAYNYVMTSQRSDVKARKVHRTGIPPVSDASEAKHYDRLAADSIYRMVRAMESTGLAWNIKDVAVSLSAFMHAYPQLHAMLERVGAHEAMVELGHLFSSYADGRGGFNTVKMGDNLRGIASELHAISGSEIGGVFMTKHTDLVLTSDILRGKIIYYMLPRLEEAESAGRMVKIFREDLEIAIGEITSSRQYNLEDPHLVIVDEGSSTFGPTWANLFELARKGRFSILFGAQSTGGLTDQALGLSEAFYERVMANVNLKVMMRVGDNRTAQEFSQWIGTTKKLTASFGAGHKNNSVMELSPLSRTASKSVNLTEDEVELVTGDELKHEMSSEKGLAWFDLGDGTVRKGRSFWFYADLPKTWEGREFLTHFERQESDGIGIAEWVDNKILTDEKVRMSRGGHVNAPNNNNGPGNNNQSSNGQNSNWQNSNGNNSDANVRRPAPSSAAPAVAPEVSRPVEAATVGDPDVAIPTEVEKKPVVAGPFKASKLPRGPKTKGAVSVFKATPAANKAPRETKRKVGSGSKKVQ